LTELLDQIVSRFTALPAAEQAKVMEQASRVRQSMAWIPSPGPQTEAYFCKADVLLYGGAAGGGKALALDTPIPTPNGWAKMGDLKPGDWVFSETGTPCRVVGVSPVMIGRPCYRVRFSGGEEIVADAEHGWLTMTAAERDRAGRLTDEWRAARRAKRPSRATDSPGNPGAAKALAASNRVRKHKYLNAGQGQVRTTREIAESLLIGDGLNHSIGVARALQTEEAALPIEPYLYGAWLGDGTSRGARMCMAEAEMVSHVTAAADVHGWAVTKGAGVYDYGVTGGMKVALRQAGVLGQKRVLPCYMRASIEQRLALLQGLMDTDGHADERGNCEFTTTNLELGEGVAELVRSLGAKATISVGRATLYGRDISAKYRVKFLMSLPAFRLERKLARQKREGFKPTVRRRYIEAADAVPSVPVMCIEVDSPSHLYLAGRHMVPTHNSDLGIGLALTAHKRSLILRRQYANLSSLTERALQINGSRNGYNGSPPPLLRTADGRYIQFAGNQRLGDEQDWQGHAFDLKIFDEAAQFLEMQVRFHLGWLRTTEPGQRVRAVLATNPPIDSAGDWMIGMFRPWLDVTHPNPAKHGELRWFVTAPDGKDLEVDGPQPVRLPGTDREMIPTSRTFIPAALRDNPFLANTGYQAQLDALPEPIRSAVRDGNFMAARQDGANQIIPTQWVIEAQGRWTPEPPTGIPMCAMALDPAGGGEDENVLAFRHDYWFGPLIVRPGKDVMTGADKAAMVIAARRDAAEIVIDMGGGYGSAVFEHLTDNQMRPLSYKGAETAIGRTVDGKLGFSNKRSLTLWRMREALDPGQPGGSRIALPPDPILRSDLTAPTFKVGNRGIEAETKDDVKEKLGRSPDRGDAVMMCWSEGMTALTPGFPQLVRQKRGGPLNVNLGYANAKKGRRK